MRQLRRFWKALDEIPGAATDRLEWRNLLSNEWPHAKAYLKSTGQQATAVMCPAPGGDGCPRSVVPGPAGTIRAVCGSRPQACDALDLTPADIAILALDRVRLVRELSRALDAASGDRATGNARVLPVGRHAVAAGLACPVLLAIPGPADPLTEDELREAGLDPAGTVVLTPRPTSLSAPLRARLLAAGHQVLALSEAVALGASRLEALRPPAILLAPIRDALTGRLSAAGAPRAWHLPADAAWGELIFTFISDEVLNVGFRGQTRRLEPDQLGMKDGRSGKPTEAWAFLQVLARVGGALGPLPPDLVEEHKKKKQALSSRLTRSFGIQEDPIRWDRKPRVYQTAFVIRDERPKVVRMAAGRR